MSRILLIDPLPLPLVERMRPMFPAGADLSAVSSLSEEELARHAADAEILLVIHRKVDAHILSILPHVRLYNVPELAMTISISKICKQLESWQHIRQARMQ